LQILETSVFACSNRGGKEVQSGIGGLEFLEWVPELVEIPFSCLRGRFSVIVDMMMLRELNMIRHCL
jgi:hypothetical protein